MSVPTVALNEATPAGGDKIREGDDRIREYKTQNREVVGADHKYDSSGQDADMGKHNTVSLLEQADLGIGTEGKPILGAQTVDGKAELVFTNEDDVDIPITSKKSLIATPSGCVYMFAGEIANIPGGYLACNGASLLRASYAALFTAIGTVHGSADGTHFNVPDMRDLFVIGAKEDDSNVPKTNVTGALTQSGGSATKDISHDHGGDTGASDSNGGQGGPASPALPVASHKHSISSGGSATQDVLNPYIVMLYMIKT